ncbi:MAG: GNAT family N-acetyltransferase [Hyphomicrobiaceae bacterium]
MLEIEPKPNATTADKAAAVHAPVFTVRWFSSAGDFPHALWAACFPPPLEGLWWYRAFERAGVEDQFTFAYAGIERDGVLVGIAPCFQMDLSLEIVLPDAIAPVVAWVGRMVPALRYQRTWFIGSPCSEEGTIGLIPDVGLAEVVPALAAAVEIKAAAARAHMIVWKDMPEKAAAIFERHKALSSFFKVPSFPGTEIHDVAGSFEGYLASLPSSHRYHLKKKLKKSRALLDLDCKAIQSPDAAAMTEIWRLFMQTYDRATTRFERLTPAFFDGLATAESTHFIMLRRKSDSTLVAFMLCYAEPGFATNKFIGIDYELGTDVFLYFRLFEEFVVWATANGATSLRSGQTGYRAKFDLGHEPAPLNNFAKNRNWLMNKISAVVAKSITWSTLDADLKTYVDARARKGERRG